MKKLVLAVAVAVAVLSVGSTTLASAKSTSKSSSVKTVKVVEKKSTKSTKTTTNTVVAQSGPAYCGDSAYDVAYRAIYNYPTGSYWQTQIAAYPSYYAVNHATFLALYGC